VYVGSEEKELRLYRNNITKGRRGCCIYEKEKYDIGDENEYDDEEKGD
jgi:hypothetical protein